MSSLWASLVEVEISTSERLYYALHASDILFTPPGDTVQRTYLRQAGGFSDVQQETEMGIFPVQLTLQNVDAVLDDKLRATDVRANDVVLRIVKGDTPSPVWTQVRAFEYSISFPGRGMQNVVLSLSGPLDALALKGLQVTVGERLPIMGRDTRLVG